MGELGELGEIGELGETGARCSHYVFPWLPCLPCPLRLPSSLPIDRATMKVAGSKQASAARHK